MSRKTPQLPNQAALIVERVLAEDRRVLLFGPPGTGKSTLMRQLADVLGMQGRACRCLSADPGSPAFGVPGAVALAERAAPGWRLRSQAPLCTLNAGRFRLPLLLVVRDLLTDAAGGVLLVDAPGVVRGVAGSELLQGLVQTVEAELVLALLPSDGPASWSEQLAALSADACLVPAVAEARRPGKAARARSRTALWDHYLGTANAAEIDPNRLTVSGTPPPLDQPDSWTGRQIALFRQGRFLAMGEVLRTTPGGLLVRTPGDPDRADHLLVRDAGRTADGLLESTTPFVSQPLTYLPSAGSLPGRTQSQGPRPVGRVGGVDVALVNGLFGDPLLQVRLRHQSRNLLFDLGDNGRLSARLAHQVSDVFISHAHMDHLGGFLWLLRSRLGEWPACRLYGPPGLARHVEGLVQGFLWDRIGDNGPAFQIGELHGDRLLRFRLQAGKQGRERMADQPVCDGLLLDEPGFRVRAVTLDHHTPVLAYAFEPPEELHVRKDRLRALGLQPGEWLSALKQRLRADDTGAMLSLPNGQTARVADLARELIMVTPAKRLVYATDLADTPDNRARLIGLARNAHTLFLEAAFSEADRASARAHGHLTTRACGEIAHTAGVSRLVPFHFSRRYADRAWMLFDEIEAVCGCLVRPDPRVLEDASCEDPGPDEPAADFRIDGA